MSAAYLSGLVEAPPEVWLALPVGAHEAKQGEMRHRVVRWSHANAFDVGMVVKEICRVPVRYTGPARTVVDLLRYGRRIGNANAGVLVARQFVEADGDFDEIVRIAELLGVPKEMRRMVAVLQSALGSKRPGVGGFRPGQTSSADNALKQRRD